MIARRSYVVSSPANGLDCRKRVASSLEERRSATTPGSGVESSILRHSRRTVAGFSWSQRSRFRRATSMS
jgi:hypothetical protein